MPGSGELCGQRFGEPAIHDRRLADVDLAECSQFLVGVICHLHIVNHPGVAHGPRVLHGQGLLVLQWHDGILHVQHVQHGEERVAAYAVQPPARLGNGLVHREEFILEIGLDEFLIAAELGRMIAADALVPVGGGVVVEGGNGQVGHAVIGGRVQQDGLVGECLLVGQCWGLWSREHVVTEVSLVDIPEVGSAEHQQTDSHGHGGYFLEIIGGEHGAAHQDDQQRATGIGLHHGAAHLVEVGQDGREHVLRDVAFGHGILQHLHLAGTDIGAEEHVGHQPEEQGEAAGEGQGRSEGRLVAGEPVLLLHDIPQRQHGQQGDGELGNDEDGGHGAELVIHGYVVEEEVGPRHEVLAPRQRDAEECGGKKCPFHRALDDEKSQDEEEEDEGPHIDRPAGSGLLAPVLCETLIHGDVGGVGLCHGRLALGK